MMLRSKGFQEPGRYQQGAYKTLPAHVQDDLVSEYEAQVNDCMTLEGVTLHRAQGAAMLLKELIETMQAGNAAPLPESRITGVV